MHPHEARHERTGTGRLCHLSLTESEIIVGERFVGHPRLAELLADPQWHPALLWPDASALPLDTGWLGKCARPATSPVPEPPKIRHLLFLILDGSWSQARTMFRDSPCLHALPRIRLRDAPPSAWRFKRQPASHCLSTLETIHQLLLDLQAAGLDHYDNPGQLPALFQRLQEAQTRLGPANALPKP